MKKHLSLVILFIFISVFSQQSKLDGNWILDKETFANGDPLEVNNPSYSYYSQYKFSGNKMEINGIEVPITITPKQIITPALKIDYEFQGKYLILKNSISNNTTYLLNPESFIEMYPEFQPEIIVRGNETSYAENDVFSADFNYKGGLISFWMDFFSNENYKRDPIEFVVEFIVSKDSKIQDIKFLKLSDQKIQERLTNYIKASEKFYNNRTGKNVYYKIPQKINFRNHDENYRGENDDFLKSRFPVAEYRKFNQGMKVADDAYIKNDFKKAIELYEKIDTSKIHPSPMFLNLGISYLVTENIESACLNFKKAGGLTNFRSRNYVINFCNKN